MGKDGFMFAASAQIPRLLADFERSCLNRWTPCHDMDADGLVEAIAITHVEFILIHPFREGNGRLSRLLADVMAVQSGREPLDYSTWNADKPAYIQAIHQGVQMEYAPMKRLVAQALTGGAV
jgi:cell filamentation protein